MKNQITIREAITEADIAVFWGQLHTYHMRDIFPDSENENRKHFLDDTEYRAQIQRVHDRQQDRCYYLFFHRDGQDIGFALPAIFTSEDGKCFILEFCIFPAFRGGGTGRLVRTRGDRPGRAANDGGVCVQYEQQEVSSADLRFGKDDQRQEPRGLQRLARGSDRPGVFPL